MRDAFGSSFVFNLIIVLVGLIMFILIGSLTYSKAFKVKNNIVNIIDRNGGYTNNAKLEIETFLNRIGYRVNGVTGNPACNKCEGKTTNCEVLTDRTNTLHRYCVYKYETNRTVYYGVQSYMYFDVPVVGGFLEFPIYGETKSYYKK